MTNDGDTTHISVGGSVSGQMAVGRNISQHRVETTNPPVSAAERSELAAMFEAVRGQVRDADLPVDRAAALERVDELETAVTAPEPDLSTMEYVRNWFLRHAPKVGGAVVSVIVHPIVGRLVEAAGDAVASEFRHRFIDA